MNMTFMLEMQTSLCTGNVYYAGTKLYNALPSNIEIFKPDKEHIRQA
jgi:hypothetical protein